MKSYKIFLFIFLLAATLLKAQSVEEIISLLEYEKYLQAEQAVKQLLQKDPENTDAFYYGGKTYLLVNKIDSAKIMFEQGLKIDDESALNMVGLGKIALLNNDNAKAESEFNKALDETNSKDVPVLVEIGEAYSKYPQYFNKAIELLNKASEKDRKNYRIYMMLGDIYIAQNNASKANENYNKALDYNKGAYRAYLEKGKVYSRVRNYAEAEKNFRNVIQTEPNFPPVYRELGELFYETKKYDEAIENYKKYVELAGASVENLKRLASIQFVAKDHKGAVETAEALLQQEPDNAAALKIYSYALAELSDSVKGVEAFRKYFQVVGKDKATSLDYETYGNLLSQAGEDSLAVENYRMSYQLDSTKKDLLSKISAIYVKQKKWEEAITALKEKVALGNVQGQDYYDIGKAYYFNAVDSTKLANQAQNYQGAVEYFTKLIELKADFIPAHIWLARSQAGLDPESEEGLAKPSYEKIIELASVDTAKYKNELIEAYSYLGYHYYLQKDNSRSKEYWVKVKELDPENEQATMVLKELK